MLKYLLPALLFATAAYAQEVPTDLDIVTQRAKAAEAQNEYVLTVVKRMQANEKAVADYWKAYVDGLSDSVRHSE